jgi:hypothetical protein
MNGEELRSVDRVKELCYSPWQCWQNLALIHLEPTKPYYNIGCEGPKDVESQNAFAR